MSRRNSQTTSSNAGGTAKDVFSKVRAEQQEPWDVQELPEFSELVPGAPLRLVSDTGGDTTFGAQQDYTLTSLGEEIAKKSSRHTTNEIAVTLIHNDDQGKKDHHEDLLLAARDGFEQSGWAPKQSGDNWEKSDDDPLQLQIVPYRQAFDDPWTDLQALHDNRDDTELNTVRAMVKLDPHAKNRGGTSDKLRWLAHQGAHLSSKAATRARQHWEEHGDNYKGKALCAAQTVKGAVTTATAPVASAASTTKKITGHALNEAKASAKQTVCNDVATMFEGTAAALRSKAREAKFFGGTPLGTAVPTATRGPLFGSELSFLQKEFCGEHPPATVSAAFPPVGTSAAAARTGSSSAGHAAFEPPDFVL